VTVFFVPGYRRLSSSIPPLPPVVVTHQERWERAISGVARWLGYLFARAGITGRKSKGPHILRHTFGTFYVRAGGSVSVLQLILGHEDLATTMIYVHLAGNDVKADHARHLPIWVGNVR